MRLEGTSTGDVGILQRDTRTFPSKDCIETILSRSSDLQTKATTELDPVQLRREDADEFLGGAAVLGRMAQRYKTELCRSFAETGGKCRYGERCQFAHGQSELRTVDRHPRYKTELCRTFHSRGFCAYGARCHFIHNVDETRLPQSEDENIFSQMIAASRQLDAALFNSAHLGRLPAGPEVTHLIISGPTVAPQRLIDHGQAANCQLLSSSPVYQRQNLADDVSEQSLSSVDANRGHQMTSTRHPVDVSTQFFPSPISAIANDELFGSRSRLRSCGSADSSCSDASSPSPSSPTTLGLALSGSWPGFVAGNMSDDSGYGRWLDTPSPSSSPSLPDSRTALVGVVPSSLDWSRHDLTADCVIASKRQPHQMSARHLPNVFFDTSMSCRRYLKLGSQLWPTS